MYVVCSTASQDSWRHVQECTQKVLVFRGTYSILPYPEIYIGKSTVYYTFFNSGSRSWIQDPGSRIQGRTSRILDPGTSFPGSGYILDPGPRSVDLNGLWTVFSHLNWGEGSAKGFNIFPWCMTWLRPDCTWACRDLRKTRSITMPFLIGAPCLAALQSIRQVWGLVGFVRTVLCIYSAFWLSHAWTPWQICPSGHIL